NSSLLEIVLLLFVSVSQLPTDTTRDAGTPVASLRSRIWQPVTVLLSLPVIAPVLKSTTPTFASVAAPSTTQFRTVLLEASLMNAIVAPPVFVLRKVK